MTENGLKRWPKDLKINTSQKKLSATQLISDEVELRQKILNRIGGQAKLKIKTFMVQYSSNNIACNNTCRSGKTG